MTPSRVEPYHYFWNDKPKVMWVAYPPEEAQGDVEARERKHQRGVGFTQDEAIKDFHERNG